jgi:AcrR family transcriptional regulator
MRESSLASSRGAGNGGKREAETARRILEGARRVLATKGWKELTVSAICSESGVYRAAVNYHFGNKDGLITALIDEVLHENAQLVASHVQGLPFGNQRVRETVRGFGMLGGTDAQLAFFEVFTHLLRDDEGRARLQRFYEDMLAIIGVALVGGNAGALRASGMWEHAALALAVADGLVIQQLIGPLADFRKVMDIFASLATPALQDLMRSGPSEVPRDLAVSELQGSTR